jgi:DNA primase catalytic core
MLEKIVEACQYLLHHYPAAQDCRDYLNSRLSLESQKQWNLGYFPNAEHLSALTDLVGEEELIQEDLLYFKQIEDAHSSRQTPILHLEQHPLIIPYRNTYGQAVALIGRTLLDEKTRQEQEIIKYKNSSASSSFVKGNLLFGLHQHRQSILENGCVYLVEGQFDAIKASEIGLHNVVATGTNSLTAYQYSLISRYSENIFLLLDNDEAGQQGRKQIVKKFGQLANIRNFYVPNHYKDIDEYITKEGISEYAELSFAIKD